MQHSLHTLQFWVTKCISTLSPTWRVKASWAVRQLLGSSCSVISWLYFPLVSHKQLLPFSYFPTRVYLLQITFCTFREKLSCVRTTGFQQGVERWVRDCALPSPAEEGKQLFFIFLNLSKLHYSESFLVPSWKRCSCNFLGGASFFFGSISGLLPTCPMPWPSGMKGY